MSPLLITPLHTKHHGSKQPKQAHDNRIQHPIHRPLHASIPPRQRLRHPIDHEPHGQDGEIQRGVVMMHVRHTRHGHERHVMQEPASEGVQPAIVDVVDLAGGELVVAALPAHGVPGHEGAEAEERGRAAPVDEGVAEQEVLDDVVVPAAHAQADVQEGPLPELGGQVVLLVGVGHEGVVGGHHGDVEVHEVPEERRFVGTGVAGGY